MSSSLRRVWPERRGYARLTDESNGIRDGLSVLRRKRAVVAAWPLGQRRDIILKALDGMIAERRMRLEELRRGASS
jgi:hypothetical protein